MIIKYNVIFLLVFNVIVLYSYTIAIKSTYPTYISENVFSFPSALPLFAS